MTARCKPPPQPRREEKPEYNLGLEKLREEPMTLWDLAEALGLAKRNAREYVNLWVAHEKVVVYHYVRGKSGHWLEVFGIKDEKHKKSAKKPVDSQTTRKRRYDERNRLKILLKKRARRGTLSVFSQLIAPKERKPLDMSGT